MLIYQNFIHEDTKNRLKSGNVCCHFVENLVLQFVIQKYTD